MSKFITMITAMLPSVLKAAAILVSGHFAIVYLLKLVSKSFSGARLDLSLERFLSKALNIALHITILLSAANILGISTAGLLAALSAAAVAVALALRDSLSNIAGGILLLLAPRFATGDLIEENGEIGTVMQVDLMHTTIRTPDHRQITTPNGLLINSRIINYSREHERRVELCFPISYGSDAAAAEQIAVEAATAHPLVLTEPEAPFARVYAYDESSVGVRVRVWCRTPDYWQVYYDMLAQIRSAFDGAGIEIPFNQLEICVKNAAAAEERE